MVLAGDPACFRLVIDFEVLDSCFKVIQALGCVVLSCILARMAASDINRTHWLILASSFAHRGLAIISHAAHETQARLSPEQSVSVRTS